MQPPETLRTLEVVASNDPALLPFLLDVLAVSPARPKLIATACRWSVSLDDLRVTATRAARDLDRLQHWGAVDPCKALHMPNLSALLDFAAARRLRVGGVKLEAVERRVRSAYEKAERRRWITNFLSAATDPVSAKTLAEFLPHRVKVREAQRP